MIRRMLLSLVLVTLFLILQSTWLNAIAIYSVVPDISLLAIVYIALKTEEPQGQLVGFIAGLLQDGISTALFGFSAFIKTCAAVAVNIFSGKFYIDRLFMPIVFGFGVTLIKALLYLILALMFPSKFIAYNFFHYVLWLEAAYNALAAPVVFLILSPFDKFLFPQEKRT